MDIDIKLRSCKGSCEGYAEYSIDQSSYLELDKQVKIEPRTPTQSPDLEFKSQTLISMAATTTTKSNCLICVHLKYQELLHVMYSHVNAMILWEIIDFHIQWTNKLEVLILGLFGQEKKMCLKAI